MRRLASPREEPRGQIDVNETVDDALRLSNLARVPGVDVCLELAEGFPPVAGSPERVAQALLNLLLNARQALQDRGEIAVTTRRQGRQVATQR